MKPRPEVAQVVPDPRPRRVERGGGLHTRARARRRAASAHTRAIASSTPENNPARARSPESFIETASTSIERRVNPNIATARTTRTIPTISFSARRSFWTRTAPNARTMSPMDMRPGTMAGPMRPTDSVYSGVPRMN